ncbi:MAG TPA: hypothetical protein VNF00_06670, partial [Candidatus Acidoferrales bacterium]|nr:hypothetical protein [Candidatus Acidoferrales bacterium]
MMRSRALLGAYISSHTTKLAGKSAAKMPQPPTKQPPPPLKIESLEDRIGSLFVGPDGIRDGWRWLIFVGIFLACAGVLGIAAVAAHILHLPSMQAGAQSFTVSFVLIQEGIFAI